jgi:hypothetical protein
MMAALYVFSVYGKTNRIEWGGAQRSAIEWMDRTVESLIFELGLDLFPVEYLRIGTTVKKLACGCILLESGEFSSRYQITCT